MLSPSVAYLRLEGKRKNEERHRVVERGSAEPPPTQEEHIDNG